MVAINRNSNDIDRAKSRRRVSRSATSVYTPAPMLGAETAAAQCPYCGEPIELVVDPSAGHQRYVEDCEVCCRPIVVVVEVDHDGDLSVRVDQENG